MPPEMLTEYPETDPLFIGAERLGRLVGRSGRWVREREAEGVIERATLNGKGPPSRPVYDAEATLPKLVAFLAASKGPSPETQALAQQRVEAGRLKPEAARIELGKVQGELIEMADPRRVFSDMVVYFRQRLMHLPGTVKTSLGLSVAQTLGLQKEIRSALTDLAGGKGAAATGKPALRSSDGTKSKQRCRRSKRQLKRG